MTDARALVDATHDQTHDTTDDGPVLTIDDVARRVGMTVRNLREWRALGLLPAPTMRGRAGFYDEAVVRRVEDVQRLHAEGFPLDLIRRMLDTDDHIGAEVMRLAESLRAPLHDDGPAPDPLELAAAWGVTEPEHLQRAVELGLMRAGPDGSLTFTSPRVPKVGTAMQRMGLSIEATFEATAAVRASLDDVAARFEQVWLDHVWEPFVADGMPEDRQPEIAALLAELPERALDAVIALFTVAMAERIDAGIAREATRASGQSSQSSTPPPATT